MKYRYTLPPLKELAAAAKHAPDAERLYRLALSKAMYQAVRDWPRFRQNADIMEAAKEACKQLLLEEIDDEGTAVTNSTESFSLLFLQTYHGAYEGVIETAKRSFEEMLELVRLLRHRTEDDAIAVLAEMTITASNEETS